jgi:triacylglycerol esterase/lipase EstA (alpha/beta hydrolase family)
MERKNKIVAFVKGLILAISLDLVMIPNKALAIEENTWNNIPVGIEDKRHINQTDDLQVNKAVEAKKQKEDTKISKKEEQMALAQIFFYDEVDSIPIEEIISESNEYVLKDIKKASRRRILSPDQIKSGVRPLEETNVKSS